MTVYSSPDSSSSESSTDLKETKKTIYESIRMIYTRSAHELVHYRNFGLDDVDVVSKIKGSPRSILKNGVCRGQIGCKLLFWELGRDSRICGVITDDIDNDEFETWFIMLLVKSSNAIYPDVAGCTYSRYTDLVTNLFVDNLKYNVEADQWGVGESVFRKSVDFFTSKWIPIEAVLPAFPCKSSNKEKVAGKLPDKGEELALRRMIEFSKKVKEVYPPGFIFWIVSDGHVFSDCIGVDDDIVDTYGKSLRQLYQSIKPKGFCPIRFQSLPQLFSISETNFNSSYVESTQLVYHLQTKITEESDICRKILVRSCDTDCGQLRKDIRTPGHPRVQLYRGFSKFMLEDLALLPTVNNLSKKKLKKIAEKVSFEMIKRNDAYSNLVELMFPFHLRLSIHAHNNSGPKFGIRLLSNEQVKVIKSIDDFDTPEMVDYLHIPTPWHNSILKMDHLDHYFVIKSGCIYKGIQAGRGKGSWNPKKLHFEFKTIKS